MFSLIFSPDTEGSFIVERVVDIAKSAIQHLKGVAEGSNDAGIYFEKEKEWESERERERHYTLFLHRYAGVCWSVHIRDCSCWYALLPLPWLPRVGRPGQHPTRFHLQTPQGTISKEKSFMTLCVYPTTYIEGYIQKELIIPKKEDTSFNLCSPLKFHYICHRMCVSMIYLLTKQNFMYHLLYEFWSHCI